MGNRAYASRIPVGISILLLISAFFGALPHRADAASFSAQAIKRLCDRQEILGSRLPRALINPILCNGTPTPEPTLTFTADPTSIDEGESSTLSWQTTNASSCTASNGWSGNKNTSGTQSVTPSETTTYTLSCSGAGGTVTKSVTVNVDDAPLPTPEVSLNANPTTVAVNGTSTLAWESNDASACVASGGWSGTKALDGSEVVTLSATTTYTIACGNGVSTSTDSVTVNVAAEPDEPTVEITADPEAIDEGDSSELTWNSENATSCTASNGWSGTKTLDGNEEVSPSVTTTYAIECTGPGGTAQDSVTVTVDEQDTPSVNLSANPSEVTPGAGSATSTLTWTTTEAGLCLATGGWSGARATSSSEIVQPNATTTYTLECSNEAGTSTDSVTVNFVPEEPEPSVDHILISEMFSDVDASHGADTTNEWIELYNPTNALVDLSHWTIKDATTNFDRIPNGTTIAAGGFLILTNASTTPSFWGGMNGVQVIAFGNALGSGLNNTDETLFLRNAATSTVDSLSWGQNTDGFASGSGAQDVIAGHSLVRMNLGVDTNTNADWSDDATPAPGVAN